MVKSGCYFKKEEYLHLQYWDCHLFWTCILCCWRCSDGRAKEPQGISGHRLRSSNWTCLPLRLRSTDSRFVA